MQDQAARNLFFEALNDSLDRDTLVKISLGNYKGTDTLKNIYVKAVLIRKQPMLSFTYRHKTRDIVKNYPAAEAQALLAGYIAPDQFRIATLMTTEFDGVLSYNKQQQLSYRQQQPSHSQAPERHHDRSKQRKLEAGGKTYLQELKITDAEGKVYKQAQDKFRQINHYIEILSTLLRELPEKEMLQVVDMGAGKGYLTFALFDYLNHTLHKKAAVRGVEFRKDLVDLCNQIAARSGFTGLSFAEGTIEAYEQDQIDVLIALHACDTATDDAIAKGIQSGADLIVVAPCCHKQIRREMEQATADNDLDFILRHGIFMERQAEMLTDALRALILEYYGYHTKVFEFISDAHTPKNVLIVGTKKGHQTAERQRLIADKIKNAKAYFGITRHHLEQIMELG